MGTGIIGNAVGAYNSNVDGEGNAWVGECGVKISAVREILLGKPSQISQMKWL